jgi:hypothetical protein
VRQGQRCHSGARLIRRKVCCPHYWITETRREYLLAPTSGTILQNPCVRRLSPHVRHLGSHCGRRLEYTHSIPGFRKSITLLSDVPLASTPSGRLTKHTVVAISLKCVEDANHLIPPADIRNLWYHQAKLQPCGLSSGPVRNVPSFREILCV